jgi:hypothetical protein
MPHKLSDTGGLYLYVTAAGGKLSPFTPISSLKSSTRPALQKAAELLCKFRKCEAVESSCGAALALSM